MSSKGVQMSMETDWRNQPRREVASHDHKCMVQERRPFDIMTVDIFAHQPSPLHWHDAVEIGYVVAGRGLLVLPEHEYSLTPDAIYVIGPTEPHMGYAQDELRLFIVHFHPGMLQDAYFGDLNSPEWLLSVDHFGRFQPRIASDSDDAARLLTLLKEIEAEAALAAPGWPVIVKGLLLQITGRLFRSFPAPIAAEGNIARQGLLSRLTPVLRLIEQRIDDPPSLEEMAAEVALHPNYFLALFSRATGHTPISYRNMRRIQHACHLLATSDYPVAWVADQCGFAAVQSFNRMFRQFVGETPASYRRNVSRRSDSSAESSIRTAL